MAVSVTDNQVSSNSHIFSECNGKSLNNYTDYGYGGYSEYASGGYGGYTLHHRRRNSNLLPLSVITIG